MASDPFSFIKDKLDESGEVGVFVEDGTAVVATVEDVAARGDKGSARCVV